MAGHSPIHYLLITPYQLEFVLSPTPLGQNTHWDTHCANQLTTALLASRIAELHPLTIPYQFALSTTH